MMRHCVKVGIGLTIVVLISMGESFAQNPLIRDQYTADPSARVFGDRVYIYPSHDILANAQRGRKGWFCMEDYHVFSSENLTDWTDHGTIIQQHSVPWVKPDSYSMWAPDCIYRNGKYYFYFPSTPKDTTNGKGFTIGVAVADNPIGPFVPQARPIARVHGIDPNVFIDQDGQAYLYWSEGKIYGAKLADNMLELASEPVVLHELPDKGLKEGPYLFSRNGRYYLTYPHVAHKTERLEYAMGDHPLGPFKFTGVIMDESPACWTNHHSILSFKKQWYLFYHFNDLSPAFDKARSIRTDSLFFNADGSIRKVIPTYRGVGVTDATKPIQIDRYSAVSDQGVSISFLDSLNTFQGWKSSFNSQGAWLRYNTVDFGAGTCKTIRARVASVHGGVLLIRADHADGALLARLEVPKGGWKEISFPVLDPVQGIHDLFVSLEQGKGVQVDWVRFE